MNKLNNKGFAVTTVLYGLVVMLMLIVALMMSHMSNNRYNTTTLVKTIEEELNRFSETQTSFDTDLAEPQEYIVPYGKAGWYRIELWGASGTGASETASLGRGAYTSGMIYLQENDHLYFYIGKEGKPNTSYNGGATDVRLVSGTPFDSTSMGTRIMVAAGGTESGGIGGTLMGLKSNFTVGLASQWKYGQNAGSTPRYIGTNCVTGQPQGAAGGGFYYGGDNEGGSSFIAGYAGVISQNFAVNKYQSVPNPGYYEGNGAEYVTRNFNFYNGDMVPGVNKGNGNARIQLISQNDENDPPLIKTDKLKNVKKVKVCVKATEKPKIAEIQMLYTQVNANGYERINRAYGKAPSAFAKVTDGDISTPIEVGAANVENCVEVEMPEAHDLDEVAVWFDNNSSQYTYSSITVTYGSGGTYVLKDKDPYNKTAPNTPKGYHVSRFQPDTNNKIENGYYYIIPSNAENAALTLSGTNVEAKLFSATPDQKWNIQAIDGGLYKITNVETDAAIQSSINDATDGQNFVADKSYTGKQPQMWDILPIKDGYYSLSINQPDADGVLQPMFMYAQTSQNNTPANIAGSLNGKICNRQFKIIPAE